jgi:hypothetical protein
VQDTIIVGTSYPDIIAEDLDNVPFADCLYAHSQLFFQCHLRPTGRQQPKNLNPLYNICPDDLLFNLVFLSTFEKLNLPIHGSMEDTEALELH